MEDASKRSKTNIVHFRNRCKPLTDYVFKFGSCALQVVKVYKYLDLLFDEFVTFDEAVKVLSDSAGRDLGAIIAKFTHVRDILDIKLILNCMTVGCLQY